MKAKVIIVALGALVMSCASRQHKAILTIPGPVVPTQATVKCVWEARTLSRWSLTPPIFKLVIHNNNAAFILLKVNGCPVVERDANGQLIQVYMMPGDTKPLDFYSFTYSDLVVTANAICPKIPSYQLGDEPEGGYVPGSNPPAVKAKQPCSEGQYLGYETRQYSIYPGDGRWRVESWEINYPGAIKIGVY